MRLSPAQDETKGTAPKYSLVNLADAIGDPELALDAYDKVFQARRGKAAGFYYGLWTMPVSGVRANPRFKEIVRELGLVDYWRSSGHWADACKPVGEDDFACQ